MAAWYAYEGKPRAVNSATDAMRGAFLGPSFTNAEIEEFLRKINAPYERLSDDHLFDRVADELAAERVVGWLQGRMELLHEYLGV